MARPWIEFIQSQAIAWQPSDLWGARPGIEIKVLSRDPETGAASLLVRYPAGWRRGAAEALSVDEEFLVLDGGLALNGRRFGGQTYAHLPAGHGRRDMSSEGGAVVLTFLSALPATRPQGFAFDPARLVEPLDTLAVPYTGNFHPEFPPGAGRKRLYEDPVTGDQSWILGTLPLRWAERAEVHPMIEEMYLLSGEVHGDRGVMRPGAYFWRPPGKPHGPYGTRTGNLYFFRSKGGKLSTTYQDAARPFHWNPAYEPMLPPDLAAIAMEQPPSPRCW